MSNRPPIYVGNGRQKKPNLISISVCLDDIVDAARTFGKRSSTGSKTYIDLDLWERRGGPDRYGNTHSLSVNTFQPDNQSQQRNQYQNQNQQPQQSRQPQYQQQPQQAPPPPMPEPDSDNPFDMDDESISDIPF